MKASFLIIIFLLATIFTACKKTTPTYVVVIKDCTGSYIRFNDKDYHVCNREMLNDYHDGDSVVAYFTPLKNCTGTASHDIVCAMVHANAGWIQVVNIRKK